MVTAGGLYGRIEDVHDTEVMIEISPGTTVRIAKRAVAGIITEEGIMKPGELRKRFAAPAIRAA